MHIVISEFMDSPAVQALSRRFDVRYDPDLVEHRDALLKAVEHADALIVRNRSQVDADLLAAAPRLAVVGRLGVGLDNIDLATCTKRGIKVIPAVGANARAVAEYVMGAMLVLLRGTYGATADVSQGKWPRTALSNGLEAHARTFGMVGFGGIGQLTASLARGLGMRVIACDDAIGHDAPVWQESGVLPCRLETLLAQADVVSLHLPLVASTRNLFNAERLSLMKPGSLLINTSRGGIVDEAALAQCLRQGHLRGAALDVFEQEPLPAGSPLADTPNLLLTPHIAGLTIEANTRVSDMVADGVTIALTGGTP